MFTANISKHHLNDEVLFTFVYLQKSAYYSFPVVLYILYADFAAKI